MIGVAVLCGLLGALTFRIRGGLFDNSKFGYGVNLGGGQVSRLTFCFASSATMLAAGETRWWVLLLATPAEFLGCVIGLWHSIDLGTQEDSFVRDYPVLSLRGLVWTLPTLLVLTAFGYNFNQIVILAAAGFSMGTLYWIAEYIPLKVKGLGKGGFTEIGEALTGFTVCFATYYTVLWSNPCSLFSLSCFYS